MYTIIYGMESLNVKSVIGMNQMDQYPMTLSLYKILLFVREEESNRHVKIILTAIGRELLLYF